MGKQKQKTLSGILM